MRRQHALLRGGLLLFLLASPASAEGLFGSGLFFIERPSYELEAFNSLDEVPSNLDLPFNVDVDKTLGVNAHLTRAFGTRFEAEVEIEYLRKSDVGRTGTRALVRDGWGATANFKACLRGNSLRPYLSAGIGMYQDRALVPGRPGLTNLSPDLGVRVGAGLDLYVVSDVTLSLVANYLLPVGGLPLRNSAAFGLGARIDF